MLEKPSLLLVQSNRWTVKPTKERQSKIMKTRIIIVDTMEQVEQLNKKPFQVRVRFKKSKGLMVIPLNEQLYNILKSKDNMWYDFCSYLKSEISTKVKLKMKDITLINNSNVI